jgi:hypothetical protein
VCPLFHSATQHSYHICPIYICMIYCGPSPNRASSFHTSQLVIVILTRATFRPHSCNWAISFSCYRPIIERLNQSVMPNQIRAYNMNSGCRRTFKLTDIQRYLFSISLLYGAQSGAVEACWAHNPEVRGSKPGSANRFCISFTDVK